MDMLHLRSPLFFYRAFRRAFFNYRNETLDRIAARPDPPDYEGNIRLRNLIAQVAELPIVRNIFVHFVMIDLTAGRGNPTECCQLASTRFIGADCIL